MAFIQSKPLSTLSTFRTVITSALLLAATLGTAEAADISVDRNTEQAIRQLLSNYQTALNQSDTATIARLYTRDGVQMAPGAPAAVGNKAVAGAYEATFKAIDLELTFTVDEITPLGSQSAILRSHSNGKVSINGSGQPAADAAFKELFVVEQEAGEWKFSHYSFSEAPLGN